MNVVKLSDSIFLVEHNVVSTLALLCLIGTSSLLQVMRTTMLAWMRSNFV